MQTYGFDILLQNNKTICCSKTFFGDQNRESIQIALNILGYERLTQIISSIRLIYVSTLYAELF